MSDTRARDAVEGRPVETREQRRARLVRATNRIFWRIYAMRRPPLYGRDLPPREDGPHAPDAHTFGG